MIDKFTDDNLKKLFKDIIGKSDSNDISERLEEYNPWKDSNNLDKDFPAILEKDAILIDLLKENIEENKKNIEDLDIDDTQKSFLKKLLEISIKSPFQNYEHAFDGNLKNPRVLILGINPRFIYGHPDYNLLDFYKKPFNENRVPLQKSTEGCQKSDILTVGEFKIHKKDYYFGKNQFFYKAPEKDEKDDEEVLSDIEREYNKHREMIFDKNQVTPLALLEFFPYASDNETTWLNLGSLDNIMSDLKTNITTITHISPKIKRYFNLDELLYSQQWLLCVMAFIIKSNPTTIIYLRKDNEDFRDKFNKFLEYFPEVQVLSKVNPPSQKISLNNTKYYRTKKKLYDKKHQKNTDDSETNNKQNDRTFNSNLAFFKWLWFNEEPKNQNGE